MASCSSSRSAISLANFSVSDNRRTLNLALTPTSGTACFFHKAAGLPRQILFSNSSNSLCRSLSCDTRLQKGIRAAIAVSTGYNEKEASTIEKELQSLISLRSSLAAANSLAEKIKVLDRQASVKSFFGNAKFERFLDKRHLYLLKCLVAIGQRHVLDVRRFGLQYATHAKGTSKTKAPSVLKSAFHILIRMIDGSNDLKDSNKWAEFMDLNFLEDENDDDDDVSKRSEFFLSLQGLLSTLEKIDRFYDCIGGIVGYQVSVLEIILASKLDSSALSGHYIQDVNTADGLTEYYVPLGIDLSSNKDFAAQAVMWGIEGLPILGEIYPLGGSGDRLGLIDKEKGDCLPVAMLPFCGRTLLEGLIRDLQAREFLYYKLHGKQIVTPLAIMTSSAKDNHRHIMDLCEKNNWFGRGKSMFKLFEQPLVPTVSAQDAQWLTCGPFKLVLKPGGHGVIWKLAGDEGVYEWFYSHGCKAATVRQISNPVASTDVTLLALAGIGIRHGKKLGFASCQRKVGATEGVNVLVERRTTNGSWEYGITSIEYTEFDKLGIADAPISPESTQAQYPANTNVLYVDLASVERIGSSQTAESLPGMILNLKKHVTYKDHYGMEQSLHAGRLECTMQNVADSLLTRFSQRSISSLRDSSELLGKLDTFIVYNERRKVTSSAKRERRKSDSSLHQTPEGSFLDIMRNAHDLFRGCSIQMPMVEDNSHYVDSGPPFLVFLHPALGPLWEITRQKFQGGSIEKGSELQLEISEFFWKNVDLDGSLVILAKNIMGSTKSVDGDDPILRYGHRCARCRLWNVNIINKGVDWNCSENVYWQHKVQRLESLRIILQGNAEFEAYDVVLEGDHTFEVPDGYKLCITHGVTGIRHIMQPISNEAMDSGSWHWRYSRKDNHVCLEMVECN